MGMVCRHNGREEFIYITKGSASMSYWGPGMPEKVSVDLKPGSFHYMQVGGIHDINAGNYLFLHLACANKVCLGLRLGQQATKWQQTVAGVETGATKCVWGGGWDNRQQSANKVCLGWGLGQQATKRQQSVLLENGTSLSQPVKRSPIL